MASGEGVSGLVETAAAALVTGQAVPPATAAALAATTDVLALGALADDVRQARHGRAATFARVHEVALDGLETAAAVPAEAVEVRLLGQPATLAAAVAAVTAARRVSGDRLLRGFWLDDLAALGASAFADLAAAGLDGVAFVAPGNGAAARVAAARAAGLAVDVIAVEQPPAERLAWIADARRLADAVGGVVALAPLPRQIDRATPTTGFDDVRTVALTRLLAGDVPHIQVDWRRYGPKLAQVALSVGADDLDAVPPLDDPALGPRRAAAEDVRRNIAAAGLTAVERDGRWAPRAR